jgi:Glycosyltransferase family 9 (heptosyltransferase)
MPMIEIWEAAWLKKELSGKTILLHVDNGHGDTLQYLRYVPILTRIGAKVLLEVQPSLAPLLSGFAGSSVLTQGSPLPKFDCHYPLVSLPNVLGHSLAKLPAELPYLSAPPEKIAHWRREIEHSGRAQVGLAWAGNPMHRNDHNRTIPLKTCVPLLSVRAARFVSLQQQLRDGDVGLLDSLGDLTHVGDRLKDFADTAAIISLLDLVITVDTAIAHLAGALGRPVWILLSYFPDWRWTLTHNSTPLYPTARLFRQPAPGDWTSVIQRVADELQWEIR